VPEDLAEYRSLLEKVRASTAAVEERRGADLACARGCDQCCHVRLEVLPVEAAAIRVHLEVMEPAQRAAIERRAEAPGDRCVMLAPDGSCDIYEARPLVCRTQGHALAYPAGVIPEDAVRARAGGDVTWCPLNYRDAPPSGPDVLWMELLDRLLFVVNQRFAELRGPDPESRTPLATLATGG
jgi:Fe-S-cluster containining protein